MPPKAVESRFAMELYVCKGCADCSAATSLATQAAVRSRVPLTVFDASDRANDRRVMVLSISELPTLMFHEQHADKRSWREWTDLGKLSLEALVKRINTITQKPSTAS